MTSIYRYTIPTSTLLLVAAVFATEPPRSELIRPLGAAEVYVTEEGKERILWLRDDYRKQPSRLREAVSRAFDARQAVQRAEVERLRRELAEIEAAIAERERQRERIIEGRVQELLQPDQARSSPMSIERELEQAARQQHFYEELEGTWRFVTAESSEEGWDQPLEVVRKWVWWIRGAELHGPGPVPGFTDATFVLDPHKSPRAIDIRYPDGTTLLGIYERKDDHLTVCLRSHAEAARGRPEKFMFEGDAGLSLLILRKVEGGNE